MSLDLGVFNILNGFAGQSALGDQLIVFCAEYLPYVLILILAGFAFMSNQSRRDKLTLLFVPLVSGFVARLLAEAIRFFYHRPRPFVDHAVHQLIAESSYSFPSGHAIFFFALSAALFAYNRTLAIWFLAGSAVVSVARVMAGIHYPSDILAGAVLGAVVGHLISYLARHLGFSIDKKPAM